MSLSHHSQDPESLKLFLEEMAGVAKREWPNGRIAGEDDGALAFAIAADTTARRIIIRFPKPVEWLGLTCDDAMKLRNMLDEKVAQLIIPTRSK